MQRTLAGAARRAALGVGRSATGVLASLRPGAAGHPPAERSVLDDLALRRPWNLRVRAERAVARRRSSRLRDGVSVVVVNWNTAPVTADVLRAVRALSPATTEVLLVDNGSTDASRDLLGRVPGVRTLFLRSNAGHGAALDIALCRVRTTIAVTLDSDAVPLSRGWLEPAVGPLQRGEATLAGSRSRRNFVHPIYLAIDVRTFLDRPMSFQVHRAPRSDGSADVWGTNAWDTAELLTPAFAPDEVVYVERTPNPADGLPGMTAGGVVYHHGGLTRATSGAVSDEAFANWRHACEALGLAEILVGRPAELSGA